MPQAHDLQVQLDRNAFQRIGYPIDPDKGLDPTATAIIAVINNPDLKAERAKRGIDAAQAFSAGLLPDPQLTLSADHPTGGPDTFDGLTAGVAFDFRTLLTRQAQRDAAGSKSRATDMDVLWQEWQVIQKARTLYAQKYFIARKHALLGDAADLYAMQAARAGRALAAGDVTLDQASADLGALADAQGQARSLDRETLQTDNDLDALLGLAPGVVIRQLPIADPVLPHDTAMQQALAAMPTRRPDLMALQAAYDSEEATLHKAVLEQFPSVSLGVNHTNDISGTRVIGLGATLDLPIFNRNRGEIAVQDATREQLRLDYQARLDQAQSDVATLWRQSQLIVKQLAALREQLLTLQVMEAKVERVYQAGDFPALSYLTLRNSLISRQVEQLDLELALWTNRIALDTLLAWPDADVGRSIHAVDTP